MNAVASALALPDGVGLRPITAVDLPFLERVYASTRLEELAQTGWDAARIGAFLASQFHLQHEYYQTHYADAEFMVIEREGVAIGRLYLQRRAGDLRIVDIALLPEARGTGLGGSLLESVLAQASAEGRRVSIHVEQMNPAMRLYTRLGFRKVAERGIYHLLERPVA